MILSKKGSEQPSRVSKKKKATRRVEDRQHSGKQEEEILALVRSGVEQFIMKEATIEEFLRDLRALTEDEPRYAHQLTGSVFRKIVRDAIRKKNLAPTKAVNPGRAT